MKRRDAMKRVATIMGGALSLPTIMVFQQGCSTDSTPGPGTFTEDHARLLNKMGDIIIPPTDTPGAADADTGSFAIKMLEDCYPEEPRKAVLDFLNAQSGFMKKSEDDQVAEIEKIDRIVYGEGSEEEKEEYKAYRLVKELTLFGYFTSEPGATQALEYVDIPGRYEGCIELKPGQKAWA